MPGAPFCTASDVAETLGVQLYQEPELSQVERICWVVSGMIRSRRPLIDTWISTGVLDPDLVNGVAVQVVSRILTTVSTGGVGLRSETHPEYSYELTASAAAGLNLTKSELALITPAAARSKPFSVIPR